MRVQRSLKHVRATYALGAFHGRFMHRSERRASDRCEQSIIDIRPVVTAAEIMLPSSARATRGPLLPIPFRVTKYIDHGVVWHLSLEVFIYRQVAYKTCGYKIEPLQQVKKKKCSDVSRRLTTVTI